MTEHTRFEESERRDGPATRGDERPVDGARERRLRELLGLLSRAAGGEESRPGGSSGGDGPPGGDGSGEARRPGASAAPPQTGPRATRRALAELAAQLERERRLTGEITRANEELAALVADLAAAPPLLVRCEGDAPADGPLPRLRARIGGALRVLPLHPRIAPEEARGLAPWDWLCVHPSEHVVVGVLREEAPPPEAYGEIVALRGWVSREARLARVAGPSGDERVVRLAPALDPEEAERSGRLVLLRDEPSWAIAVVDPARRRGRFEVPLAGIDARFDDLGGLDELIGEIVEAIGVRVLRPDLARTFGLAPLRGMLLYSEKPGMGKTALARALACWLREVGEREGFEVALHLVPPNALKSVWHGGDARNVREELFGALRARRAAARERGVFQLVVLDECDSLGRRGAVDATGSAAHNDAVQAFLAELDGFAQEDSGSGGAPFWTLFLGLTNRPELVDEALKRPGRLGDLVRRVPDLDREGAEAVLAAHLRGGELPWLVAGEVRAHLPEAEVRRRFLRPVLARLFDAPLLSLRLDGAARPVTVGEVLAGAHYRAIADAARRRAAARARERFGPPAVTLDDVREAFCEVAAGLAAERAGDPATLVRELRLSGRMTAIVPESREALLEAAEAPA